MRKLTTVMLLFTAVYAYGQQEIQFTQFMQNRLYYNPGATGAAGSICITGMHRSQWVGFDNAPVTQNLNAEVPLDILHGGVGINITNDQIGFFNDITAGLMYAYQMPLGPGSLGLGIQVDFRNKTVTNGEWITPDGGNSGIGIPAANASNMSIDANFGVYYQSPTLWGGISSTRLLEAEADLMGSEGGVAKFKSKRAYILMAGYDYALSNSNFVLNPALMVKTDFAANPAVDIHLGTTYNNKIWGGVSYRLGDALGIMAGYYITPDFKITYAYDLTLSQLRTASSGSHEILLGYCFNIEIQEKEPGYYRDPRFL
ncbi:MAG: type IX secretion system membrane protein PorP/SprF [Schleiferiaceae bacterium]|jgi:type IX secretion system PorP/SprF family membrane protein|nr:type IX secretion system membrane protein PorP/SprF [Schleiferiaceae bacterium]